MSELNDKEKYYPPVDPAVEAELDAVLAGVSMDEVMDQADTGTTGPLTGLQTGRVLSIDAAKDEVFVDLGGKRQGVMPFSQFELEPTVGSDVEVMIERFQRDEGLYILARKGAATSNLGWESLQVGSVVEGTVEGMNKGGLEVKVGNLRGFMPAGQIDLEFHKDISVFLGQRLTAEVTQIDKEKKKLVVSRRKVLEAEREVSKGKLMEEISEGQTRRGIVRNVAEYGAFVDLGGADGLIHVSELTYNRHQKPSEVVKTGDVVEVKILRVDRETGKIGLSLKATMNDPWADTNSKYGVGTSVTARVVKIENFGAFLEVEQGVEGLLPISEMSWQRIRNPREVVQDNQTLHVLIIALDTTARKITFSLKQAQGDPWKGAADKYPKHSIHTGKVLRTAEFGAFIELEKNVEGLAHISELSEQRVRNVNDVAKVGDEVKVRVLEVNEDTRRISLSLKQTDGSASFDPASVPTTASSKPAKKRDKPLRGGLDFRR